MGNCLILSNRFNKNHELHQMHHFVELTQLQAQSVRQLLQKTTRLGYASDTNQNLFKFSLISFDKTKQQHLFC